MIENHLIFSDSLQSCLIKEELEQLSQLSVQLESKQSADQPRNFHQ